MKGFLNRLRAEELFDEYSMYLYGEDIIPESRASILLNSEYSDEQLVNFGCHYSPYVDEYVFTLDSFMYAVSYYNFMAWYDVEGNGGIAHSEFFD